MELQGVRWVPIWIANISRQRVSLLSTVPRLYHMLLTLQGKNRTGCHCICGLWKCHVNQWDVYTCQAGTAQERTKTLWASERVQFLIVKLAYMMTISSPLWLWENVKTSQMLTDAKVPHECKVVWLPPPLKWRTVFFSPVPYFWAILYVFFQESGLFRVWVTGNYIRVKKKKYISVYFQRGSIIKERVLNRLNEWFHYL